MWLRLWPTERAAAGAIVAALSVVTPGPAAAFDSSSSDDVIKRAIIAESIGSYSGNCPCPYNRARNGSQCGKRSAYSRPGGAAPLCYPSDVTNEMVRAYRQRHSASQQR